MSEDDLTVSVREVVKQYAGLKVDADTLDLAADLYAAGMTSFASVEVMLGLEDMFGITFTQDLIQRGTFLSIAAMAEAVSAIRDRN